MTEVENVKQKLVELKSGLYKATVDAHGGYVTSFSFNGQDIIFPRPELGNEKQMKRSGIPVLSPVAGPLKGTSWENVYPNMPQHGTRRISTLSILSLKDNGIILQQIEGPRNFRGAWSTTAEVTLTKNGLTVIEIVENLEDKPGERAVAFHPYFNSECGMSNIKPNELENLPAIDESRTLGPIGEVSYTTNSGDSVNVRFSPPPIKIVDWRGDSSYRCIEPWWAKKGDGITFGPLEKKSFTLEIEVTQPIG